MGGLELDTLVHQRFFAALQIRQRLLNLRFPCDQFVALRADLLFVVCQTEAFVNEMLEAHPELEQQLLIQIRREMLRKSRNVLGDIFRRNMVSEEVYNSQLEELDSRIQAWETIEKNFDK